MIGSLIVSRVHGYNGAVTETKEAPETPQNPAAPGAPAENEDDKRASAAAVNRKRALDDSEEEKALALDGRSRAARQEVSLLACRRCPRLVAWREAAARNPPRRFAGQSYWARPVPAFGDPAGRILIVGLAPAANGANRPAGCSRATSRGNFSSTRCTRWPREPAGLGRARRRTGAPRCAALRGLPLRAAGQQADARRARELPRLPGEGPRGRSRRRACSSRSARPDSMRACACWRRRARRFRSRSRGLRMARDFGSARMNSSRRITRASRTPSPGS